jgi:transposase
MKDLLEICCGLDVHKETIVACLLKGTLTSEPQSEIREFSTLLPDLEKLKNWLTSENCMHVAMESTGVYWFPVYDILEDAFNGNMNLIVANARHMKNVPGKKTDKNDASWIATLLRAGLLSSSFVPVKEIRELRDLTRYRKSIVSESSSQKNRIEKHLQSCGFKLSTFLSDIFGVSGRAIINYIADNGFISVDKVDEFVKRRARQKLNEIKIAVNGKMSPHQKEFLKLLLSRLDETYKNICTIENLIEIALSKYQIEVSQIDSIPGVAKTAAASIIAEIGVDMSKFKTSEHICSWAGLSPRNEVSAGKKKVPE